MASSSSPSPAIKNGSKQKHSGPQGLPLPILKTWGSQRLLRCIRVPEDRNPVTPDSGSGGSRSLDQNPMIAGCQRKKEGTEKINEKPKLPPPPPPPPPESTWNLRTRRASYARSAQIQSKESPLMKIPPPPSLAMTLRRRTDEGDCGGSKEPQKQRRRTLSVTLSREEIDEDILALTGRRAPRRPRRRSRALKRQLDMLFPGFYLTEVTAGAYEVVVPHDVPQPET